MPAKDDAVVSLSPDPLPLTPLPGTLLYYLVNGECTCRDAQYRSEVHKGWCKHMLAVELYKEAQPQGEPSQPEDTRSLEEQLKDPVYWL